MIFFLLEAIITTNSILTDQVSQDSIEKPEEPARSRHCNSERICRKRHWGDPGRRRGAMNWSQENCLIDDHRLTCERWGGDLRLAIGSRLLDAVPTMVLCAHVARHAARQRYFAAPFPLAGKRLLLFCECERTQCALLANVQLYALYVHRFHRCRRKMLSANGDCG